MGAETRDGDVLCQRDAWLACAKNCESFACDVNNDFGWADSYTDEVSSHKAFGAYWTLHLNEYILKRLSVEKVIVELSCLGGGRASSLKIHCQFQAKRKC